MTDVSLNNITSGYNTSKLNSNFTAIQESINGDLINRAGGNNTMGQDLDLNSNNLLNVAEIDASVIRLDGDVLNTSPFVISEAYDATLTKKADLASTAAGKGGDLVGFVQSGTGASDRTIQEKSREIVSITDFEPGGGTDWGVALQAAHDRLPSLGGQIDIPPGAYPCTTGVTFTKAITINGCHMHGSLLKLLGNNGGVPFIQSTTTETLRFANVGIVGDNSTGLYTVGSIAYKSTGSTETDHAEFLFWETISVWNGGFYHKHMGSSFRYFKNGFSAYTGNNLSFTNCNSNFFSNLVTVVNGIGPISYTGGSIEGFVGFVFTGSVGVYSNVSISGTYIENYSTIPVQAPLTSASGFYDGGTLAVVYDRSVTITGCSIQMRGIARLVDARQATGKGSTVFSSGNSMDGTGFSGSIVYNISGANSSAMLNDSMFAPFTAGTYYFTDNPNAGRVLVRDLTTGRWNAAIGAPSFTAATLQNGWVANGTSGFDTPSYAIDGAGKVTLKGSVNGSAAATSTIFTLPAGYIPAKYKQFMLPSSGSSAGVPCRISNGTGAVFIDATGPWPSGIGLDGVSFYVGA